MYLFVWLVDVNVAGIFEEGEYFEQQDQDQGHFVEQGKLFSELALPTYASTFITCLLSKQDLQNPFQKYMDIILPPYVVVYIKL